MLAAPEVFLRLGLGPFDVSELPESFSSSVSTYFYGQFPGIFASFSNRTVHLLLLLVSLTGSVSSCFVASTTETRGAAGISGRRTVDLVGTGRWKDAATFWTKLQIPALGQFQQVPPNYIDEGSEF